MAVRVRCHLGCGDADVLAMISLMLVRYWWLLACALVGLSLVGCATQSEKFDPLLAVWQRNSRLCDQHGGIRRIDVESDHADIWCRSNGKGYRVWYYK